MQDEPNRCRAHPAACTNQNCELYKTNWQVCMQEMVASARDLVTLCTMPSLETDLVVHRSCLPLLKLLVSTFAYHTKSPHFLHFFCSPKKSNSPPQMTGFASTHWHCLSVLCLVCCPYLNHDFPQTLQSCSSQVTTFLL